MDLIKRALLGDKKAQEELTEKYELLPCPHCNSEAYLFVEDGVRVICGKCSCSTTTLIDAIYGEKITGNAVKRVIEKWNTRPQILNDEEMERLEKE